jgi:hypothetical protein
MPEPSGNPAFDAAKSASISLFAQTVGPLNEPDNSAPPVLIFQGPGPPTRNVSVPAPQLSQAALNQATIVHKRQLALAAIAAGVSPAVYIQALQALGAALYP